MKRFRVGVRIESTYTIEMDAEDETMACELVEDMDIEDIQKLGNLEESSIHADDAEEAEMEID